MAWTKTVADADTYFAPDNHIAGNDWARYSASDHTAAWAQAKRYLEASIGRYMEDPANTDDVYRDDYAVSEMALHLLRTRPASSAPDSSVAPTIQPRKDKETVDREATTGDIIPAEVAMWLRLDTVTVLRG